MSAQGTGVMDFGAATPGTTDTSLVITGQPQILAASAVEAWIIATATADHSIDEHWVEDLEIDAGNIVAGTGFTIYAKCNTGLTRGQFNVLWVWY